MLASGSGKRHWLLLLCAGILLALAGCGGGENGGEGGGEPPPGTYTAQQRSAATGRVAERLEALIAQHGDTPSAWAAASEWASAQPEFTAAGVGDRSLWAQFTDGRYFLYTDNWRAPRPRRGAAPDAQGAAPEQPAAAPRAAKAGAAPSEVPGASRAAILSMKGLGEFDSNAPMLARMEDALKERGWTVAGEPLLTISSLKSGGALGFLFVTSHSGIFGPTGHQEFALMLEDQVSLLNEDEHAADLADGSLIYHRDRTAWQRWGFGTNPRYAATAKFVGKHLKFAPNSLVILLSCNSGSAEAAGFRSALLAAGAGTIIGWENNSSPMAYPTVDAMMDRLAGMNVVRPVTPANRPFNLDDVWAWLDKNKLLVNAPIPAEPGSPPSKEAYVRRFGSGFSVLSPVVHSLQAIGKTLFIHGEFGSEPGSVTVGGVGVAATWEPARQRLRAILANDTHGAVVVSVRNLRSNARVLGDWKGSVTYRRESEEVTGCNAAKFHNTAIVDLHLRADMHGVRKEVDGAVENNPHYLLPVQDSRVSWTAGGVCVNSDGSLHTRWSGNGRFGLYTDLILEDLQGPPPQVDLVMARIDAVERRFQLNFVFPVGERVIINSLGTITRRPLVFDYNLLGFVNRGPDFTKLLPYGTFIPFSGQLQVAGGGHVIPHPGVPTESMETRWGSWSVTPAYDDRIGR